MFPPRASFPPVRNHCLIKCHLASIQPQKVAVAVEFLSRLRVSPLSKKKKKEMTGELCDPGLRRPLLSSLRSSLAWEQEGRVADLPVGRGSVTTLPRNAGLAPAPALRRAPAGGRGPSPSPLLHLQSLFIYLWKLKEPEPATGRGLWSQKKSVSGLSVCRPHKGKKPFPGKGVGGENPAERPLCWKRYHTHPRHPRRRQSSDHFGGPMEEGERGLASGVPQTPAACIFTAKVLLSGRKGRLRRETEEVGTLGHTSLYPLSPAGFLACIPAHLRPTESFHSHQEWPPPTHSFSGQNLQLGHKLGGGRAPLDCGDLTPQDVRDCVLSQSRPDRALLTHCSALLTASGNPCFCLLSSAHSHPPTPPLHTRACSCGCGKDRPLDQICLGL